MPIKILLIFCFLIFSINTAFSQNKNNCFQFEDKYKSLLEDKYFLVFMGTISKEYKIFTIILVKDNNFLQFMINNNEMCPIMYGENIIYAIKEKHEKTNN